MSTLYLAARPVPTMTAVGVARPSAQGQAITRTVTPNIVANRPSDVPALSLIRVIICYLGSIRDMEIVLVRNHEIKLGLRVKMGCT